VQTALACSYPTTPLQIHADLPAGIDGHRTTRRTGHRAAHHQRADLLNILNDVAQVLAYVLTGARRYTDLGMAAEIQRELLPVLAYELPRFSIAGALEPTNDIGGDTFDYAVSAQQLTVSITDASITACARRC
jgi:serine phosphatase RsbU (regulator of sigma subunit)